MHPTTITKKPKIAPVTNPRLTLGLLFLLFYPLGTYQIWRRRSRLWVKLIYTVLGFPLFLVLFTFGAIVFLATFLPPLDLTVGNRPDRTIYNKVGNYETTFLKTGRETNNAYELLHVEVEPQGGNGWHYHKTFAEQFTVQQGELTVGLNGKKNTLTPGQTATAYPTDYHYFFNNTNAKIIMLVKATPARGLEKSLRVYYGLANTGQWEKDKFFPNNPWHLALILGYSESYMADLPGFIQEPLVKSLAKIAQWKGEDRDLKVFYE